MKSCLKSVLMILSFALMLFITTSNANAYEFEPNLKADKKVVHPPYAWGIVLYVM